ncbi:uncharacterized protein LOC135137506 [Zophobas morio]|uniref:uncharacterized protein LOC135137506 n=1 Tax=Zophobas morio TaxID=2755281 RepID=UPI003083B22D
MLWFIFFGVSVSALLLGNTHVQAAPRISKNHENAVFSPAKFMGKSTELVSSKIRPEKMFNTDRDKSSNEISTSSKTDFLKDNVNAQVDNKEAEEKNLLIKEDIYKFDEVLQPEMNSWPGILHYNGGYSIFTVGVYEPQILSIPFQIKIGVL